MTHISQDLHNAFPDDEAVLRIEAGTEPASDIRLEEIKKHRLALLDDIAACVAAAKTAA